MAGLIPIPIAYGTNDIDEASATITYIGKESRAGGEWLIIKINESSSISFTYASQLINPTITTYADAWTNRATLTYASYDEAM